MLRAIIPALYLILLLCWIHRQKGVLPYIPWALKPLKPQPETVGILLFGSMEGVPLLPATRNIPKLPKHWQDSGLEADGSPGSSETRLARQTIHQAVESRPCLEMTGSGFRV